MKHDFNEIVLRVYDCVADPGLWPEALDMVAAHIGARGSIIFEWDMSTPDRRLRAPICSSFHDPGLVDYYVSQYFAWEAEDQDRFEALSLEADGIDLVSDLDMFESIEAMLAQPNVQALAQFGIPHRAAGLLNKDNRARARFSAQFDAGHGPIRPDENAALRAIAPHLAKALDLETPARQLGPRTGLLGAMDRLSVGVCLVDRQGRVIETNAEFDRQQDAYPGFGVDRTGALVFEDAASAASLSEMLRDLRAHGRCGARPRKEAIPIRADSGPAALCIEITPLHRAEAMGTAPVDGALVFSLDTSRALRIDPALLGRVYGFSAAEQALIESICEGRSNAAIAAERNRSVETVNTQVKALLAKTGTANRTQLVRAFCTFGANMLRPEE